VALKRRPHTWTVAIAAESNSGGMTLSPHYLTPVTVRGQISGISSEAAYRTYGQEVTQGFELLCNTADATYHAVGAKVIWNAESYIVKTDAITQNHNSAADHARFLIQKVRNDA